MLSDKFDMGHKHTFQGFARRRLRLNGFFNATHQAPRHPLHYRLQNGIFIGKMTKNSTLSQPHAFGDGSGGNIIRVLLSGEFNHCLNRRLAPFFGWQMLTGRTHCAPHKR